MEDKIKAIIADQIGCDIEECCDDTNLYNDLGYDSLDQIELVTELEDEFDIEIPEEDSSQNENTTVKEIVDYVVKQLKK